MPFPPDIVGRGGLSAISAMQDAAAIPNGLHAAQVQFSPTLRHKRKPTLLAFASDKLIKGYFPIKRVKRAAKVVPGYYFEKQKTTA